VHAAADYEPAKKEVTERIALSVKEWQLIQRGNKPAQTLSGITPLIMPGITMKRKKPRGQKYITKRIT
jgi:hypothetical protein